MHALPYARSPLVILVVLASACASSGTSAAPPDRATVTAADRDPNEPIERALERKFPGLRVTRTPDGLAFQIRGSSSYVNRDTPPLLVLNGLPVKSGPRGELIGVDPHEIDAVKVLTSAEAGMYGIEGANGVILITTKRGAKPQS